MADITFREYTPDDAEDLLEIRNAIFPPLTVQQWRKTEHENTASMAYEGDEVVGAIPLEYRTFKLAPGCDISVCFEHAVGTREDMRGRGIGSGMIQKAREFLQDHCEMLLVYRGAERSIGYNFYVKSGHVDLIYMRGGTWDPNESPPSASDNCSAGDLDDLLAQSEDIHPVYQAMYGDIGGFPPRSDAGYWQRAMSRGIYMVIPQITHFIRYPAEGDIEAYLILGQRTGERADQPWIVQEAASSSGPEALREVFNTAGAMAADEDKTIQWSMQWEHPLRDFAADMGFETELRGMMIMGQVLAPQRLFKKACVDESLVEDLRIRVWTPTTDYVLYEGPQAKTEVTIEAKDWAMIRLLARRLDLAGCVAQDIVTVHNGTLDIIERITSALPYNPWCYHAIDYT